GSPGQEAIPRMTAMPPCRWCRRWSCSRHREARGKQFPEDGPRRRRLLPEEAGERSLVDEFSMRRPHMRTEFAPCHSGRERNNSATIRKKETTIRSWWRALTAVDSEAGKGTCHAHHYRNRRRNTKAKADPKNCDCRDSAPRAHRAACHVRGTHA